MINQKCTNESWYVGVNVPSVFAFGRAAAGQVEKRQKKTGRQLFIFES